MSKAKQNLREKVYKNMERKMTQAIVEGERMTDERLVEIEATLYEDTDNIEELLQALKAERKSLNDCARDNTKFRQRISELEAKLDRVQCAADELAEALADE